MAQAMSRIRPIAAKVAMSDGRIEPSNCSRIGVTDAFFVLSHFSLYSKRSPSIVVSWASGACIAATF